MVMSNHGAWLVNWVALVLISSKCVRKMSWPIAKGLGREILRNIGLDQVEIDGIDVQTMLRGSC